MSQLEHIKPIVQRVIARETTAQLKRQREITETAISNVRLSEHFAPLERERTITALQTELRRLRWALERRAASQGVLL